MIITNATFTLAPDPDEKNRARTPIAHTPITLAVDPFADKSKAGTLVIAVNSPAAAKLCVEAGYAVLMGDMEEAGALLAAMDEAPAMGYTPALLILYEFCWITILK